MNVTFFSPPGAFVVGEMFALRADENKCQVEFENYSLLHFSRRSSEGRKPLFYSILRKCCSLSPGNLLSLYIKLTIAVPSASSAADTTSMHQLPAVPEFHPRSNELHKPSRTKSKCSATFLSPINLSTITENNIFSLCCLLQKL